MSEFDDKRMKKLAGILTEQNKEEEFVERLPPNWEDYGFNSIVINDIGEDLVNVEHSLNGLKKAKMLANRLDKAIKAFEAELQEKNKND